MRLTKSYNYCFRVNLFCYEPSTLVIIQVIYLPGGIPMLNEVWFFPLRKHSNTCTFCKYPD